MCIGAYKSSAPEQQAPAFKIGDRVYVHSGKYGKGHFGTIQREPESTMPGVDFEDPKPTRDDGSSIDDLWVYARDMELAPKAEEAPAPAPVVFKNGDRVVFLVDNEYEGYSEGGKGVIEDDEPEHVFIYVRLNADTLVLVARDEIAPDTSPVEEEALTEDPAPAEEPSLAPGVVPFEINGEQRYFKLEIAYGTLQLKMVKADGSRVERGNLLFLKDDGTYGRNYSVGESLGLMLNKEGRIKKAE